MTLATPDRHREPLVNVPAIILALIGWMAAVHLARQFVSDETDVWLLGEMAFVPARVTWQFDAASIVSALQNLGPDDTATMDNAGEAARFFLASGDLKPWTFLSYAFFHADITHIGFNSFWLLAFGSAVARRFGALRFAAFFAITAIAGAAAHWLAHPAGFGPVIGASAAVSGAMAAAARFVFQPDGPVAAIGRADETRFQRPALPLTEIFFDRRVLPFLAVWLLLNVVTGLAAVPLGLSDAPIAWEAHIGGFVAGLVLFDWFDPPIRR